MKKILPLAILVSSVACGDTYNSYATGEGSGNGSAYTAGDACEGLINCDDQFKHDYGKDMDLCLSRLPEYITVIPGLNEACFYECFATQCQDNMEDHCFGQCR